MTRTKFSLKLTVTEIFEGEKVFLNSVFRKYLSNGTSAKLADLPVDAQRNSAIFLLQHRMSIFISIWENQRKPIRLPFFFFFCFFFFCEEVGVIGKRRAFSIIYISLGTVDILRNQNLGILFYPPLPSVILLARKNPIFKNYQTNFGGH